MTSAGFILLMTIFLAMLKNDRRMIHAVAFLTVLEGFFFAHGMRDTFKLSDMNIPKLEKILSEHRGEESRTLNRSSPNIAMRLGTYDIWGSDPGVIARYAEWMAFTQGQNPDTASQYLEFRQVDRLYTMIRCHYELAEENGEFHLIDAGKPMPHVLLVGSYRVVQGRDSIFRAMSSKDFDPRQEAILENEPHARPAGQEGTIRVVASTASSLTIEADVPQPTLAIITDLWSSGWRVRDLAGSSNYELLPANYVLRGIPLTAGRHRFIVEYSPAAWRVGVWISILALAGYAIAWGFRVCLMGPC